MSQHPDVPPPAAVASTLNEHQFERRLLRVRGSLVMLDSDLAELYGVPTKVLNQAVRRNAGRFPPDFMFQLTTEDVADLRSQIVTSSSGYGGRRYHPLVFTEQGVAMLSSVLKSERAVEVNIAIMRAFVRLRQLTTAHGRLVEHVGRLERTMDAKFRVIFTVIEKLSAAPHPAREEPTRRIGFHTDESASVRGARALATRSVPPARHHPGASSPP